MTNEPEKILQDLQATKLTSAEKAAARHFIQAYMSTHPPKPLRDGVVQRLTLGKGFRTRVLSLVQTNRSLTYAMPIILMFALLLSGGVAVGAEGAVPGNALYPIKILVTEPVRSALTFSQEGKAQWEAQLAIRRLTEAEELSARGTLSVDAQRLLEEKFTKHAERAQERLANLVADKQVRSATEIGSEFEARLHAHQGVLAQLAAGPESSQADVTVAATAAFSAKSMPAAANAKKVIINIAPVLERVVKQRQENESKITAEASAEVESAAQGKMKAAQNKLEEVKKFIAEHRSEVSAEAAARVAVEVEAAELAFAQAKVKLQAAAYGEAFVLFGQAHERAQRAKELLQAQRQLQRSSDAPTVSSDLRASVTSEPQGVSGRVPTPGVPSKIDDLRLKMGGDGAVKLKIGP